MRMPDYRFMLPDYLESSCHFQVNYDGVIVVKVEPYSASAEAGIQKGDLIVKIEDKPVDSVNRYREVLRQFKKGEVIIFSLKRGKADLHAFIKLPE